MARLAGNQTPACFVLSQIPSGGQNAAMHAGRRKRWRRAAYGLVGLFALLCAAYFYLTNPERLRAKALATLRNLSIEDVELGEVTFSPWHGLQLHDVVIDPLPDDPAWRDAGAVPPLLNIGLASIRCDLIALLFGYVRPTAIELHDVAAALVYDPVGDESGRTLERTDAEARFMREWLSTAPERLPRLAVEQADVQLLVVERGRPQLIRRLLMRADGQATADGYDLHVDRRPAAPTPLAQLRWQRAGDMELSLDWADLKTVTRLAPPRVADILRPFAVSGRARLNRAVLHMNLAAGAGAASASQTEPLVQLAAAELSLANLGLVVPIEEDEGAPQAPVHVQQPLDRFLQIADGAATVTYRQVAPQTPGELGLRVDGRLRGAPTTLSLTTKVNLAQWFQRLNEDAAALAEHESAPSLDNILQAELSVEGLQLPTAATYPAFVNCARLGGPVRAVFQDYQPHGKVNLRLRVLPAGTLDADGTPLAGATRLEGEIEARGAGGRYVHFPYDFDDTWGYIRLMHGRIVLDTLCARHGGARVCAEGLINNSRHWAGFDLTFRGQDVALEGDLYAALPEDYRQLWQHAAPQGQCEVVTKVRRAEGSAETGPLPPDVQVTAHLSSGSVALSDGQRLNHADGWLSVHGGEVTLRALRGYAGDAHVRLDGSLHQMDGSVQHDLRVEVADLRIEENMALAPGAAAAGPQVRFVGHADAWGRVWGTGPSDGGNRWFAVRLKDGELYGLDPARHWTASDGLVRADGERRELLAFNCRQGDARLDATGILPAGGQPLTLQLHATTPAVEQLYPQFVPADWTRRINTFGLAGPAEILVQLHPAEGDPARAEQIAEVDLHAERMKPSPLPLDLQRVEAELTLGPGHFQVHRAVARWGEQGMLELTQPRAGSWQSGNVTADFKLSARGLTFGPDLNAAAPEPLRRLLDRLALRGHFDLVLPNVGVSGEPRRWQLAGDLPLRDVALHVGLDLAELNGHLSGTCAIQPDGEIELNSRFAIERAVLAGRPLERCEGQLLHEAGDRWVRIENLQGRLCDGVAQGFLRVDPRTSDYELSVQLYDVSAAQLLPPSTAKPERPRRGRLDGEVWLRGREGEGSSRRGGGELRLTGASFIQTPVLAAVFQQRAQSALADTVDQAQIRFRWEGGDISLERIDIRSKDLRLVGEGTWKLDGDAVHMTLWGARPEHWPRLSVVSDWLESAGQELVQYRVEGTWAEPRVTAEPLHKLNAALRRLLGEE